MPAKALNLKKIYNFRAVLGMQGRTVNPKPNSKDCDAKLPDTIAFDVSSWCTWLQIIPRFIIPAAMASSFDSVASEEKSVCASISSAKRTRLRNGFEFRSFRVRRGRPFFASLKPCATPCCPSSASFCCALWSSLQCTTPKVPNALNLNF